MKNLAMTFVILILSVVSARADSLNCRLVGNWPFGPSHAVAVAEDSGRVAVDVPATA